VEVGGRVNNTETRKKEEVRGPRGDVRKALNNYYANKS